MNQLDLGPDDYRKQDRKTGRWLQNVDKKFCRWASLIPGVTSLIMAYNAIFEPTAIAVLASSILGFSAGSLFTMSLKSLDW